MRTLRGLLAALLLIGWASVRAEPPGGLLRLLAGDLEWPPREPPTPQSWSDDDYGDADSEDGPMAAEKRSAVMAALTAGSRRLRRVPAQHARGVLDSVGDFMGSLRHSLKSIHESDHSLLHNHPNGIYSGGVSSSGSGTRRLYALRPLHPNMHIRSYDRRSFVGAAAPEYRGANQHDPGYLWTGLGRR